MSAPWSVRHQRLSCLNCLLRKKTVADNSIPSTFHFFVVSPFSILGRAPLHQYASTHAAPVCLKPRNWKWFPSRAREPRVAPLGYSPDFQQNALLTFPTTPLWPLWPTLGEQNPLPVIKFNQTVKLSMTATWATHWQGNMQEKTPA